MATNRIFSGLGSIFREKRSAADHFCKLLYAPVETLSGEIIVKQTGSPNLGDINFQIPVPNWYIATIPNFKKAYKEEQKAGDAGPLIECTVSGFIPFDNEGNHKLLDRLKYHRFLVLVYTPQGMIKLIGSPDNPARFLHGFSSETNGGTPGTTIQFTWTSADKPLLYKGDGIIPNDPNSGGSTNPGGGQGG